MINHFYVVVLRRGWLKYGLSLMVLFQSSVFGQRLAQADTAPRSSVYQPATFSLIDALAKLKSLHKVNILFEEKSLRNYQVPAEAVKSQSTIEANLNAVLQPLGLRFKKKKNNYIIISGDNTPARVPTPAAPGSESAQSSRQPAESRMDASVSPKDRNLSGRVIDERGEGLPGVSILLKGSHQGTVSDKDGSFSIQVPDNDAVLVFSFVGFVSLEVAVQNQTRIDITMKIDEKALEEVVVVGYGEQSRELLTTSISKLDNKVLQNTMISNAGAALQGTIPGLRVINTSGQPGSTPSILLRGGASINTPGAPLVVVDGIARTINDINPSDIESVEVLKDAASTAIYGARANNGVILITTKRGKSGVAEITYNLRTGVSNQRDDYGYLNARDYIYFNRLGVRNSNNSRAMGGVAGVSPDNNLGYGTNNPGMFDIAKINNTNRSSFSNLLAEGWDWMIDPYNDLDTLVFKDHSGKVADQAFRRNTFSQDHHISFTGGNDKGKFLSSIGYYKEQGILIGTEYERFSGSLNGSYKIKDNIEISSAVNFTNSKRPPLIFTNDAGAFYIMRNLYPTFRPTDENGNPATGRGVNYGNPNYWMDKYIRKNNARRTTLNFGAKWEIIPGLQIAGQANIFFTDSRSESFDKEFKIQTSALPDLNRLASASTQTEFQQQHNLTLQYKRNFSDHNFSILGGGEVLTVSSFLLSAAGSQAPTDDVYTLNSARVRTSISSSVDDYRILSAFGRLNYDYDGRFLFTSVIRYDGNSRLSQKSRWGIFPGMSVGWNIHREKFFSGSRIEDYLSKFKVRMSYGVNGNIAGIGNYEVQGVYSLGTPYNQQSTFLNTGILNEALRWEKSRSLDVGMDISSKSSRVTLMVDYFRRESKDLLTNLALPDYTGFSSFRTNLGSLLNSGFESDLNFGVLRSSQGLNWDLGFNVSYVKNKILQLPFNGNERNRQGGHQVYDQASGKVIWVGGLQEGGSIGDVFGFVQERILKDWEDVNVNVSNRYDAIAGLYGPELWNKLGNKSGKYPIEPGDVLWADLDRNDTINSLDRVKMGNIYPKWTGGVSTSLSYKNFSVYSRLDYAIGHVIYNHLAAQTVGQYSGTLNSIDWVKDMWREDNTQTDLPKFYYADLPKLNIKRSALHNPTLDDHSSRFYEKGDYLSLREITLSYSFPVAMLQKIKLSSCQLNITGQNLLYMTRYSGSNPELGGVDEGRYPLPKIIILGLKISI